MAVLLLNSVPTCVKLRSDGGMFDDHYADITLERVRKNKTYGGSYNWDS
jgi:hypothetical protein